MAFLAQHCGSDFSGFSKNRSKAFSRSGVRSVNLELARQVRGFGDDEVAFRVRELCGEVRCGRFWLGAFAESVESGELCFELARLPGIHGKVYRGVRGKMHAATAARIGRPV